MLRAWDFEGFSWLDGCSKDGHQIKEIDAIEEETELIGRSGALPEILERDIDGEEVARLSPEDCLGLNAVARKAHFSHASLYIALVRN